MSTEKELDGKVLLSRKNAAEVMDISIRTLDTLLSEGALRAIKIHRRTLIPLVEIERIAKTGLLAGGR